MKCPYQPNITSYAQTVNEYNEEGNLLNESTIALEFHPFPDCFEEECGAWTNGACGYKGGAT